MTVRELRKIFDDCWFAVDINDNTYYEDSDKEEFEKYLDCKIKVCYPNDEYIYLICEIEEEG